MIDTRPTRHLPIGAELMGEVAHFRVWAPIRSRVAVVLMGTDATRETTRTVALTPEANGYFAGSAPASDGERYSFRLDDDERLYPDPASRFQPDGPHGPSQLVDFDRFAWTDQEWRGVPLEGQVIYEMHLGTFTQAGTLEAALAELPALAELGVTVIELMPVADYPGRHGWGYDGVNLFAPCRNYGTPTDLRAFINRAHSLGMGVILDVVYNHFGPDGNFLKAFSPAYFTDRYANEWGEAINFDGEQAEPVREFFLANARYWIEEYHFDGLRLDATQQIYDASADHILSAIGREVRAAAGGRDTLLVAENEPQETKLVRSAAKGGYGLDALWNDDFHHSAVVALTGHNDAYYSDHLGRPQEFISSVKYGYLFQGQRYSWQENRRGHPGLDLGPAHFVLFLENHDQIANSGRGERIHKLTSPGRLKALTALTLLAPGTPMLFQGQEFASSAPFLYFVDHGPELGGLVRDGRAEFLSQFRNLATDETQAVLPDPSDPATFARCKLDFRERGTNHEILALHRDLLRLRRSDAVLRRQVRRGVDGAVLSTEAFVLRWFTDDDEDRLMIVNLGHDLRLDPAPEPLLAPPWHKQWKVIWSSESVVYGGCGTPALETSENWRIPGEAAVVLLPEIIPDPGHWQRPLFRFAKRK